jgi:putative Mg2+ transporter-C (MgtC) family protein
VDSVTVPDAWGTVLRLVVATLLGAAIGFDREMSQKPAGLRTHALVSLGAALVTITGLLLARPPVADAEAPGRIIQGVLAGIGFIGGGVILHQRDSGTVHGLTTAASIWIVAVGGVAVGAGLWLAPLVTAILALLMLTVGRPVDRAVRRAAGDPGGSGYSGDSGHSGESGAKSG